MTSRHLSRLGFALAAASMLFAARAAADVWTVDALGGADFTNLQAAVDAAGERDVLLVRTGVYGPVTIQAKSLTIAAAYPGTVRTETLRILDLASSQRVLLSGLDVRSTPPYAGAALVTHSCTGTIRIDESSFGGADEDWIQGPWRGAWIQSTQDLAFHACTFEGSNGGSLGYPGVDLVGSQVAFYDCHARGGDSWADLPPAGAGCRASASFLFAQGSDFVGGDGGDGKCGQIPADGGPGLHLLSSSTAHAIECLFAGGAGGISGGFICLLLHGGDGPATLVQGGSQLVEHATPLRTLDLPSLLRPTERFELRVGAEPGDALFAVRGQNGGFAWTPTLFGVALLDPPQPERGLPLGVAGQDETIFFLSAPQISPREGESILVELRTVDAQGHAAWGGGELVTVVDAELDGYCQRPIHVDVDAPPGGDGSSWTNAFFDLKEALMSAAASVEQLCPRTYPEIWIAEGTYTLPPPGPGSDAFHVTTPMALYGGFVGSESSLEQRDPERHPTILDGDRNGDDGPGFQNYGDNAATVLEILYFTNFPPETAIVVDGLTIRGGNGPYGSGIRQHAGTLWIRNSHIVENQSSSRAAGLYTGDPTVTLIGCEIARNRTDGDGAGAYLSYGGTISGCVFRDNVAVGRGGGLHVEAYFPGTIVASSLFTGNRALEGGALNLDTDHDYEIVRVSGCTIFRNLGDGGAGGIAFAGTEGTATVANSILWRNRRGGSGAEGAQIAGTGEAFRCCIQGWTGGFPGAGCFGSDPLLDPDLRPGPGSPCIDAGWNDWIPADVLDLDADLDLLEPWPFDLAGAARLADDPTAPDTGTGGPPTVDLGAFERQ